MLRIVTGTPAHPHLQWSCFYSNYKQHFLVWITTLWRIICFCTVPLKKKLEFSVFPSNFFLHIKHNWLQNCPAVTSSKKKDVYLLSCSGLNVFVFLFKGDKPELTKSNLGKNQNLTKTDEEIQSFSLSVYWRVNSSGGLGADSRKHITSGFFSVPTCKKGLKKSWALWFYAFEKSRSASLLTYTSHPQLCFELDFGFLKAILSLSVGSRDVSHRVNKGADKSPQTC